MRDMMGQLMNRSVQHNRKRVRVKTYCVIV